MLFISLERERERENGREGARAHERKRKSQKGRAGGRDRGRGRGRERERHGGREGEKERPLQCFWTVAVDTFSLVEREKRKVIIFKRVSLRLWRERKEKIICRLLRIIRLFCKRAL